MGSLLARVLWILGDEALRYCAAHAFGVCNWSARFARWAPQNIYCKHVYIRKCGKKRALQHCIICTVLYFGCSHDCAYAVKKILTIGFGVVQSQGIGLRAQEFVGELLFRRVDLEISLHCRICCGSVGRCLAILVAICWILLYFLCMYCSCTVCHVLPFVATTVWYS